MPELPQPTPSSPVGSDPGGAQRTAMAAERTWLAWWRSALVATAGALGVGRLAPRLLHVATWPYVVLGIGYAALAIGLLFAGLYRHRTLQRAVKSGAYDALGFWLVSIFTVCGVLLALTTIALVAVQA
ncbi:MAG: YidH family protein [Solirubrobacteraceae bacterium]